MAETSRRTPPFAVIAPLVIAPLVIAALLVVPLADLLSSDSPARPDPDPDPTSLSAPSADPDLPPIVVEADAGPSGDGTTQRPFGSIQQALERAEPGQTVQVGPGTYRETIRSVRPGRPGAPITIAGRDAEIAGDDDVNHLVEITHDHLVLEGLELRDASTLVYLAGASETRILDNDIHDAEGECVRIKYQSVGNEVAGNRITDCGVEDFDLDDDNKNGEGVYIGTAPEQLDDNPTDEPDESNANHVHDNEIDVPAECVDVKEYARANVIEANTCTGSQDPDGAGLSSRGIGTVFRANTSSGHTGAGIRLGGDTDDDGTDSVVRDNVLRDNDGYGLRVVTEPQRLLCGNEVSGNGRGAVNDDIELTASC
ncbi:right-handed parallel beta-helix repeat-containing protein [soil metagenome]